MRIVPFRIDVLANMAGCAVVAAGLSMIVRPVTAELNNTLGTVWPFSTVHCDVPSVPGCEASPVAQSGRLHLALR